MPADVHKKVYILPKFSRGQYHAFMVSLRNSLGFEQSDVAQFRFRILNHAYEYGWKAAVSAYGIKKSSLYNWKRAFEKSGKKLCSLIPQSTRPHHTRRMVVDPRLIEFIKQTREEYGRVSKYKLKIFLDEYAASLKIPGYGLDKIAKIIKRNHYFFDPPKKRKNKTKLLYPRLKRHPKETTPGYVEMDSITIYVFNKKLYFITAIDIVTKFAWVMLTRTLSSKEAVVALRRFTDKYPHIIRQIQTDNGSEFLKYFDQYLVLKGVSHRFVYPHSPKVNGVVERFNRTIQDEFIDRSNELYFNLNKFNQKLTNYLVWYNTQRPHYSLKYQTPMNYLQKFIIT